MTLTEGIEEAPTRPFTVLRNSKDLKGVRKNFFASILTGKDKGE